MRGSTPPESKSVAVRRAALPESGCRTGEVAQWGWVEKEEGEEVVGLGVSKGLAKRLLLTMVSGACGV